MNLLTLDPGWSTLAGLAQALLETHAHEIPPETPVSLLRDLGERFAHRSKTVLAQTRQQPDGSIAFLLVVPALQNERVELFRLKPEGDEPGAYPLRIVSAPGKLAAKIRSGKALLRKHADLKTFLEAVFADRETAARVNGLVAQAIRPSG